MYIGLSSQNVGSNVSIEAIRSSDGAKFVIADPTSNDGSYSWQVGRNTDGSIMTAATTGPSPGSRFTVGGNYQIKIYSTSTGNYASYSSTFTVPTPTISISSPTATNYARGTNLPIRWTSNNFMGAVSLQLLTSTGSVVQTIADGNIGNSGSYDWTIPTTLATGSYKVKMCAVLK